MADICGDCRFWDRVDDWDIAECRRFPRYESRHRAQGCGEHQPLSAKAAEGVNGELLAAARALNEAVGKLKPADFKDRAKCFPLEPLYTALGRVLVRAEEASR